MFSQFFQLFALIGVGYGAHKLKLFDEKAHQGLAAIVLSIAFPCMVFNNVMSLDMTGEALLHFFEVVLVTLLFTLFSIWLCRILLRYKKRLSGESHEQADRILPATETSSVMPNDGFLGFPFTLLFFGSEGLFYMISINIIITIFLFSYADGRFIPESEMQGSAKRKHIVRALTQPLVVSAVVGVIVNVIGITVPDVLTSLFDKLGGLAGPVAMIYIGSILAGTSLKLPVREIRPLIEGCFLKLFVLPAFALVLSYALLKAGIWTEIIAKTFTFGMVMPTAALIVAFADARKGNVRLSGWFVLASTVLSVGTIPVWVTLCNQYLI